jgi:hypothetical protein
MVGLLDQKLSLAAKRLGRWTATVGEARSGERVRHDGEKGTKKAGEERSRQSRGGRRSLNDGCAADGYRVGKSALGATSRAGEFAQAEDT